VQRQETITLLHDEPIPLGVIAVSGGNQSLAGEIIEYGRTLLGVKYIYGSSDPKKGFDCSGFVWYVLKNFDMNVGRSSRDMATHGTQVNRNELQTGDLVFFATMGGSRISHVGIYISDGKFIHSSSWGEGVVISDMNSGYYAKCFVKAIRIL
jgi:cell wall-associated NlpC family hydrolase